MGVALSDNQLAVTGNSALNRFPGTEYFTNLDASTEVTVGTLSLTNSAIDQGAQGTLDIGTASAMPAGINGNNITITAQEGGPAADPLNAGVGGKVTVQGGKGGATDGILPGEDGGDVDIEGGVGGIGGGAPGDINLGLDSTTTIFVGTNILADVDGGFNIGASGANRPDYIYAKTWVGAGASTVLKSDRISISGDTSDPGTLVAGDIWYRTDLGKLKFRNATTDVELLDASTAIANPGTKATNDLLQWTGSAWDAKGAAGGDALTGPLYLGADLVMQGASGIDVLWSTDGGGDIGAAAASRPTSVFAKTQVVVKDTSSIYMKHDRLSIAGAVADPGSPVEGDFWYRSDTNKFRFYDGAAAVELLDSVAYPFTVLDSTATAAQINTALSTYRIVYLKPGSYSINDTITVPDTKALVGLTDAKADSLISAPVLTFTVINKYIALGTVAANSARLENVRVVAIAGSTANLIQATGTAVARNVWAAAGSSMHNIYAFIGTFTEVSHCRTYNFKFGYAIYQPYNGARGVVDSCWADGDGMLSSGSYGYVIGAAGGNVSYRNCYAANFQHGFDVSGATRVKITDCYTINCRGDATTTTDGAGYYVGASVEIELSNNTDVSSIKGLDASSSDRITVNGFQSITPIGTSATYAGLFVLACPYSTFSDIVVYNPANRGVYGATTNGCNFSDIYVKDAATVGFYLNGCDYTTVDGINVYSSASYDIYFTACDYTNVTGLVAYGGTATGVYFNNCTKLNIAGIVSSEHIGAATYDGVYITGCSDLTITGVQAYNNQGRGLQTAGVCADISIVGGEFDTNDTGGLLTNFNRGTISGLHARANGRHGIELASGSQYIAVTGNTCYGNTGDGIRSTSPQDVNFVGNNCCANTSDGIEIVTGAVRTMISSNQCNGNTDYGINAVDPAAPDCNCVGNIHQGNVAGSTNPLPLNANWNATANV